MSLFEGEKTAFKWLPALMRKRCRLLISPTTKEEVMFEEEGGVNPMPRIRKNME